jgi:16S rRNA (guanine527-N7)-methyltransferase
MVLSEESTRKLHAYAELLSKASEKVRLTGPSDPEVLYGEHIMDAVSALPYLDKISADGSFVDVGTGGGLPGIVWGICRPDLNGVLIDSVGKKIDMVRDFSEQLGLGNITALKARSEEFAAANRESFDAAAARAVSRCESLAEYLSPLVKVGGTLIAFKGPNVHSELDVPKDEWRIFGLDEPRIIPYAIKDKELNIVLWEKTSLCSGRFPRRPGEAKNNPWLKR